MKAIKEFADLYKEYRVKHNRRYAFVRSFQIYFLNYPF